MPPSTSRITVGNAIKLGILALIVHQIMFVGAVWVIPFSVNRSGTLYICGVNDAQYSTQWGVDIDHIGILVKGGMRNGTGPLKSGKFKGCYMFRSISTDFEYHAKELKTGPHGICASLGTKASGYEKSCSYNEAHDVMSKTYDNPTQTATIYNNSISLLKVQLVSLKKQGESTTITDYRFSPQLNFTMPTEPNDMFEYIFREMVPDSEIASYKYLLKYNKTTNKREFTYGNIIKSQAIPQIDSYINITDTWTPGDGCYYGNADSANKYNITRIVNGTQDGIMCFDDYDVLNPSPLRINFTWDEWGVNGTEIISTTEEAWRKFKLYNGQQLKDTRSYDVRIITHMKLKLGYQEVDGIFTFFGVEIEEFALITSNFTSKYKLYVPNMNNSFSWSDVAVNHTVIAGTSSTLIQVLFNASPERTGAFDSNVTAPMIGNDSGTTAEGYWVFVSADGIAVGFQAASGVIFEKDCINLTADLGEISCGQRNVSRVKVPTLGATFYTPMNEGADNQCPGGEDICDIVGGVDGTFGNEDGNEWGGFEGAGCGLIGDSGGVNYSLPGDHFVVELEDHSNHGDVTFKDGSTRNTWFGWLKTTSGSANHEFYSKDEAYTISRGNGAVANKLFIRYSNSNTCCSATIPPNQWTSVGVVFDANGGSNLVWTYINGERQEQDNSMTIDVILDKNPSLCLGGRCGTNNNFVGLMDNFAWYNDTLNDNQMRNLFNCEKPIVEAPISAAGSNVSLAEADNAPTSELTFPEDNSINESQTPSFGYIPTDDGAIFNATLYVNGTINATNSSFIINATENVIDISDAISDHTHIRWLIKVCDNATITQCTNSSERTMIIDAEAPDITIVSPSAGLTSDNTPLLNITYTSIGNATWWELNGTIQDIFSPGKLNITNPSIGPLSDDHHNITANANSSFGHIHRSEITIIVDTTPPVISHDSPVNGTNISNDSLASQTLRGIVTDAAASIDSIFTNDSIWSEVDTSSPYNFSNQSAIPLGFRFIQISANDSLNNTAHEHIFFNVTQAALDMNFQIWNGSAWDDATLWYLFLDPQINCTLGGCVYPKNVTDSAQSDSQAIYNITNNGTTSGITQIKVNETFEGATLKCGASNNPNLATNMTTSYQTMNTTVEAGGDSQVWCWADISGLVGQLFYEVQAQVI